MKKIIKFSEIMESDSSSTIHMDEIRNILSSFKIENTKQSINSSFGIYNIKYESSSEIYYNRVNDNSICFIKSSDNKYNLVDITDLNKKISEKLNREKSYIVDNRNNKKTSFEIIILHNLVHEISLYCEDILLELKDIGFSIKTLVSLQLDRKGNKLTYLPPTHIRFSISRNNKFKYSSNEEEKPIFYQTGRGFEIISLADYIDSLSDYLGGIGYGKCIENYSYGSEISLKFKLENNKDMIYVYDVNL